MIPKIEDYRDVVGDEIIEEIKSKAEPLKGKHITNINSVFTGGGVAEILNSLVLLMNDLGITVGWRILKGNQSFYDVTKSFHNALQGEEVELSDLMKETYMNESLRNSQMMHFSHHDLVVVHDPQPLAMIKHYDKKQPWIWRCHIDITQPCSGVWSYLEPFIKEYDGMVVSMEQYGKGLLPEHIIHPSIDPLSPKNKDLSEDEAKKCLEENGVPLDKPLITQISRFDKWKDPIGVIKIFEKVREEVDCRLVLMGDMAADDPEGQKIYVKVMNHAKGRDDIKVITKRDDYLVNALQKLSHVVLQNSHREGFGLTVSEALWKETPVVTRNSGGIPLQVIDGRNGFLISDEDEAAARVIELLTDDELRKELGKNGRMHVKENFLITRHIIDYLDLYNEYI